MAHNGRWSQKLVEELCRRYLDPATYPKIQVVYRDFPCGKSTKAVKQRLILLKKQGVLPSVRPQADLEREYKLPVEALSRKGIILPYVSCLANDKKYTVVQIVR